MLSRSSVFSDELLREKSIARQCWSEALIESVSCSGLDLWGVLCIRIF